MYLEKSNGNKKFNVEVNSILYNENEDLLNNHILKCIKDHDADYIIIFSNEIMKNNEVVEISRQSQDLCDFGWNYFSGFQLTLLNSPIVELNENVVEYVKNAVFENNCIDTSPRLIFKMSMFPFNIRSHYEYGTERFDLPIFLEEMLNMKILIVLEDKYSKYREEIENTILEEIRKRITSNVKSAVERHVKDAKVAALVRESLDKNKIDWRRYPDDAKNGVYHDDEILKEEERIDGKRTRFYRLDNKPTGEFDSEKFARKFCKKINFDKLCKLFYEDISWKNFYSGKLKGNETELFYKNSEDWTYLRRSDVGARDKYHRNLLRGIYEINLHMDLNNNFVKSNELINVLTYYRFLQDLNPSVIAKIARSAGITANEIEKLNPKCELIPDPVYVKDYVEYNGLQQKLSENRVYKWDNNNDNRGVRDKFYKNFISDSILKRREKLMLQ